MESFNKWLGGVLADLWFKEARACGKFEGEVITRWLRDEGGFREMELQKPFTYVDPNGRRWVAPAGRIVNGASIPRALWTMVGDPYSGAYREASVVHDVACVDRTAAWQDVHTMFYNACRCGSVGEARAKLMFWAVWMGGPRWSGKSSRPVEMARPEITVANLQIIQDWIDTVGLSLEELKVIPIPDF